MKFFLNLLKKIFPPIGMAIGGTIPITLTATALSSSVPSDNSNKSLTIRKEDKPNLIEKTINPQVPPSAKPEAAKESTTSKKDQGEGTESSNGKEASAATSDKESKGEINSQSTSGKTQDDSPESSKSGQKDSKNSDTSQGSEGDNKPKPKKNTTQRNLKKIKRLLGQISSTGEESRSVKDRVDNILGKFKDMFNTKGKD